MKCFWFYFFAIVFCVLPAHAEVSLEGVMEQQLAALNLQELDKQVMAVQNEFGAYLPDLNWKIALHPRKGFNWDLSEFLQGIMTYFFNQVVVNLHLLAKLLVLATIYAVLKSLRTSFGGGGVSKMAHAVCYLAVMGLAVGSFKIAIMTGKQAIEQMVQVMQALVPLLLTILGATGSLVSASIFQPVTVLLISLISTLMSNLVLPLICISALLTLVGHLSEDFPLERFAGLSKECALWLMGIFASIFAGAVLIQGAVTAVSDGVSLKTAKFAVGSFVPVVGGLFSDALEMMIGCSLIIRNAIGGIGIVLILLYCLFPALKIISLVLTYRLAAALVQPIGNGNLVNCLGGIANSLVLIFAALALVTLMFFILLTVLIGSGNVATMLR